MTFHVQLYFTLIVTIFFKVKPKQAQMAPQWPVAHCGLSDPVNILGKYDNLVEKSMHHVCPGTKIPQQMLESPLSSLNKQPNWADLLIIYRIESQGATAFVGDADSICPGQRGFVFQHWLSV